MKKLFIIIGLVISYYKPALSQELKTDIRSIVYFIDSTEFNLVTLELSNVTKEDVFVWIEESSTQGLTIDQKVKSYYFKNKGDFSLIQLVNENLVNEIPSILFKSLIKKISPDDCFVISILYSKKPNDASGSEVLKTIESFLKNNVVYIDHSTLSKFFDLKQFEMLYYKGKILCLDWKDLNK